MLEVSWRRVSAEESVAMEVERLRRRRAVEVSISSRWGSVRSGPVVPLLLVLVLVVVVGVGLRVVRYECRILWRYWIKDEIWAFCRHLVSIARLVDEGKGTYNSIGFFEEFIWGCL